MYIEQMHIVNDKFHDKFQKKKHRKTEIAISRTC
jgi:hypothetical protein